MIPHQPEMMTKIVFLFAFERGVRRVKRAVVGTCTWSRCGKMCNRSVILEASTRPGRHPARPVVAQ